eukprot:5452017-Pleurochrysis_carterae.AAC.1
MRQGALQACTCTRLRSFLWEGVRILHLARSAEHSWYALGSEITRAQTTEHVAAQVPPPLRRIELWLVKMSHLASTKFCSAVSCILRHPFPPRAPVRPSFPFPVVVPHVGES